MGIRQKLNEKPQIAIAFIAVVIVLGVLTLFWSRSDLNTERVTRMYFSDDDGKTFFDDDAGKIAPFDHNGKMAYQAFVYQGNGQPFVGYLSRYSDATRTKLAGLQGKESDPAIASTIAELKNAREVKRPGETKWVSALSPQGQAVSNVAAPDRSPVRGVYP